MEQSEAQIIKRFTELADKSDKNSQYIFTDFLSLAEQDLFYQAMQSYPGESYSLFGGMDGTERMMGRFGSMESFGYEVDYPIQCIIICPLIEKFAENLTHRDYLGALMNLGIERSMLGDILIRGKNAYLFCVDRMADYIIEHMDKVRHTSVKCIKSASVPKEVSVELQYQEIIVSANRADAVVSKVYNLSRSQSLTLFRGKKVYVNGRIYENNSGILKEDSVISVRGYGKFQYKGIVRETQKGKIRVQIAKYV